jgi:hypothetical protein
MTGTTDDRDDDEEIGLLMNRTNGGNVVCRSLGIK